jgi:hypothetical protein
MGKQRAPLEFNRLTGGIITEASPLTFPDSASIDEVNFELLTDGTRKRRLGFSFESNHVLSTAGGFYASGSPQVVNTFLWENVSGRNEIAYSVVQMDNVVYLYKTEGNTLSTGILPFTVTVSIGDFKNLPFDFASIDGTLVIVTGNADVITVSADLTSIDSPVFTQDSGRLTTRDLFGIPIWYDRSVETGGSPDLIDLTDPFHYTKRPLLAGLPHDSGVVDVNYVSGSYVKSVVNPARAPSYRAIKAKQFSPNTFKGFVVEEYGAWDTPSGQPHFYIRLSGGTPSFDTMHVRCNTLYTAFTLKRSVGGSGNYSATITGSQFDDLHAATEANLNLTDTTTGTVYNYNLRNQTFATSRLPKIGLTSQDPISGFLQESGKYPAMSDTVLAALYPNVEDEDNKTADRFHAKDLVENPLGTAPAPKGYFIIDALERSTSRYTRWSELVVDQGHSVGELSTLPLDITPGGASTIAEYGGRLWYGGFSELGSVTEQGGTRLESYLLYSQLANNKRVITRCYQSGDPTSKTDPDLLETDGGFLSLDGAYGINKLVPIGNSLLVFASNGVWSITGLDGNYFAPTSPRVQKITDKGNVSPQAIVIIDTSVLYWTKDGIYAIQFTTAGTYEVENLVDKTIQALYDEIPYTDKRNVVGVFDSFSNEAFWIIYNTTSRARETEMLVLKTNTGAFTKYKIKDNITPYTTLVGYAKVPPFTLQATQEIVTSEGVTVTSEGLPVTNAVAILDERRFDTKGVVIHSTDGTNQVTFGEFNNEDYLDWGETDASGYLVTGYVSGGDLQRVKQTPYITMHFTRTEDGFYADMLGDLQLSHPSGCLAQAQWDWANSANSGRWSREFQAYRYPRHYMPADVNDPFDTGFATISTRNKIRGKGRVLSLKFSTEPLKDCKILGWSAVMGVQDNV